MSDAKEVRRRKRSERCVHFTGIQHTVCKANVLYADVPRPIPCLPNPNGGERTDCPFREYPTQEQLDAEEAASQLFLSRLVLAREAILDNLKKEGLIGQGASGAIKCPNCDSGTLAFRYAGSFNGHIHGHCSTEGCISWME